MGSCNCWACERHRACECGPPSPDRRTRNVTFGHSYMRLFVRLIEEFGFALHRASQAGQSCAETCGTPGYDPPQMIVIVRTAGCAKVMIEALEREGLERP
uniref:Uncharacterized protein n=1 Tax=Tanacetum cinerariifolium TaxID=118510 RepID=A0A6L2MDA5_TANCI|nr:hypothetical protein [Tanacetum cinerariifolium]